jgi:hypothetical protein
MCTKAEALEEPHQLLLVFWTQRCHFEASKYAVG